MPAMDRTSLTIPDRGSTDGRSPGPFRQAACSFVEALICSAMCAGTGW